jgi:hypothetical protein
MTQMKKGVEKADDRAKRQKYNESHSGYLFQTQTVMARASITPKAVHT